MKLRTLIFVLIGLSIGVPSAYSADPAHMSNCITCHRENDDEGGPSHWFEKDVHFQAGVGCQDCHGGDATLDDMDAVRQSKGFVGVPDRLAIPEFCARCHSDAAYMHEHDPSLPTDQLDKYKTSIHGIQLFTKKDRKVATCVSCHTSHRIASSKLPISSTYASNIPATCGKCHSDKEYMAEYGLPTDIEHLYSESVHGKALLEKKDQAAPACNDCHGNHGAAPPGVASIGVVCGSCHAIEAGLYEISPHMAAFAENDLPMCETCHSNHGVKKPSDKLIGLQEGQLCAECHVAGDGSKGSITVDSMSLMLAHLVKEKDSATALVADAGQRGMMIVDEEFALQEIDQLMIQVRSSVHAFTLDTLKPYYEQGVAKTKAVQAAAVGLVDEYYFRRTGLGISSIIITLLAVALWLKIRAIEKP
jgi:predicted CXXCH cytochrome family protein